MQMAWVQRWEICRLVGCFDIAVIELRDSVKHCCVGISV